ncbi:RteC domain-containing protein [Tenacibaculum sp. SSH1-16]|uniref:RteC domain-containing protein n=1 Tax=Tenacibaculum sp. SSH1-16 TaxID=3136667 RepID=UPI0032C46959
MKTFNLTKYLNDFITDNSGNKTTPPSVFNSFDTSNQIELFNFIKTLTDNFNENAPELNEKINNLYDKFKKELETEFLPRERKKTEEDFENSILTIVREKNYFSDAISLTNIINSSEPLLVYHNITYGFSKEDILPSNILAHIYKDTYGRIERMCKTTEKLKANIVLHLIGSVYGKKTLSRIIKEKSLKEKKLISNNKSNIAWKGSQVELIELIKALIENKSIKGANQIEIFESFSSFFNFKINNPDQVITKIKGRNTGNETLFLDKLKTSLNNYFSK